MLPLERQELYRQRYARRRPGWRSSGARLEALVRASASPETRVLDVGSGRGGVLELVWDQVGLAVGVDPDRASLVERRVPLPVAQALGDGLPLADSSFDLALAIWVFEHLAEPGATLAEIARVLRPGGRLVFLTPNRRHPLIWANRLSQLLPRLQRRLVPTLYGRAADDTFRVHYRANDANDIARLAASAGFRMESLEPIPDPTYLAFNDLAFSLSSWLESLLPRTWGVHLLGVLRKTKDG